MLFDNYLTEANLAAALREKTGMGTTRTLRSWRDRGVGPAWIKQGKLILYPRDGVDSWLRSLVQQPARLRGSHRRNEAIA